MRQAVPVTIGSAELLVETAEPSQSSESGGGLTPISAQQADMDQTFDRVREAIEAVSGELVSAWEKSRPTEATVEFGIDADLKSGKLTGMLVSGGAAASLKVTLKWASAPDGE
ncbi:CU044_2847 family protein [Glycomyces xiaoerkulensis]|uniref:CU044_2847 family protein n=1 Tax=Glycomyces xiaoerkulensis TaxID=2038139 RepID=UPI000C259E99|nr:CU044_2847 family protein [Glycomyces xiaoerkulensis]